MKIFILILTILITSNVVHAQIERLNEYDIESEKIRVDNLGYLYTAKGTLLSKFDKDINKISQYDLKSNGEITDLDASNPFRLLVFYKDFNRIIFLDNYLAELRDPILLDDLFIYSTNAVCSSTQGSFRVFDNQNSSVNSYDKDLNLIQTGTNMFSLSENHSVIKIKESNNSVYVLFNSGEIVILDKFANFVNKPNWQDIKTFDCIDDKLYLLINSEIYLADENYELTKISNFKIDNIIDFAITVNRLFILTEKSLITFKIL